MSRTKRKTFYDDKPSRRIRDAEDWWSYRGRAIERDRYLNGRDGVEGSYGDPSSNGPKGYCCWGDRTGPNSRWCKRGAARVIRNRYKKFIREELRLLEAGDDEVVYTKTNGKKTMTRQQRLEIRREAYNRRAELLGSKPTPTGSGLSVKSMIHRHRLRIQMEMLVRQRDALLDILVHRSLLASLQEEYDTIDRKINRIQFQLRSMRK